MKFLSISLMVAGILCFVQPIRANHILGGNITWECLGGGQYQITLTIYKDCFGATPATPDETLFFFPSGCSLPFSADAPFVSEIEISDLCPQEFASSSCSGGLIPGTQELVYSIVVDLDPACPWTVSWSAGDWNYFVNLDTSSLPNAYLEATIDPTAGCNDSGTINSAPAVPYVCSGDPVDYILGFTPPPGFTYDVSLTNVLTDLGANAIYNGGYSAGVPIPGFVFNPLTGEMNFTAPFIPGTYVVAFEILLYDGAGNPAGTVLQTMPFVVRFCAPTPTEFTGGGLVTADPAVNVITPNEISVCAGDFICFDVEATNPNFSKSITLSSDFVTLFPTGTFIQVGVNPAVGTSCVQSTEAMVGDYLVTYEAVDNACNFPDDDLIQVLIHILPNLVLSTPDGLICYGDSYAIDVSGDTQYQWNVLSGDPDPDFACPDCGNQVITPDSSVVIEVVGINTSAVCTMSAIVTVDVALSPITAAISNETCNGNDGAIDLTVYGGTGLYSYAWDIPYFLQDPSNLQGGTYAVTITDNGLPGCSLDTSFTLTSAPPPSGMISGAVTICEGESADILFTLNGTGPFNLNMTPAGPATAMNGDLLTVSPATTTTYTLNSFSDSNAPSCTYSVPSSVTITVLPTLDAAFLAAGPICGGDDVDIEIDINPPGVYTVEYTVNGVLQAPLAASDGDLLTFAPAATTTYNVVSVAYPGIPSCAVALNNPVTVTVNPLPTANLSGGASICEGNNVDLTFDVTGTGPWQVDFTANGNAVVLPPINSLQYDYNVSPAATTTYCITGILDQGTNCFVPVNSCQDVIINPYPGLSFGQDAVICPGDVANLTIDLLSAPGLFNAVIESDDGTNVINYPINNAGDPYVFNDSPSITTTYTLLTAEYAANPGQCTIAPNAPVVITVADSPTALIIDTLCAQNSFSYQVVIQLFGGDATSYSVTPSSTGPGTLAGDLFTSDPITSGNGESWTITDANDCNPVVVTIAPYACPIVTYSGTMLSDTLAICGNNPAIATWNNDGVFDGFDDQLMFVLHDSPTQILGQIFATDCNDTGFNDADTPLVFGNGPGEIQYGVVYFVSAVVGDDDGSGDCVDLNALNVSISVGQPVVFFEDPTAVLSGGGSACDGEMVDVQIDFTSGQAPWSIGYTIDGVLQPILNTSDNPTVLSAASTSQYELISVNSLGCAGLASGIADVVIHPLPTALISADGAICEGSTYDFSIDLTGTPNWDVVILVDDGTGAVPVPLNGLATASSIYTVSDAGTYSIETVTDGNGCVNSNNPGVANLVVYNLPTAQFLTSDTSFCEGSTIDLEIELTGTADWTIDYTIDAGPLQSWGSSSANAFENIGVPGVYSIVSVSDANCTQALVESVTVTEISGPIADAGPDLTICSGDQVQIGTPAVVGQTYEWSDAVYLDDEMVAQPMATATNPGPGNVVLELIVLAQNFDCPLTDTLLLTVFPLPVADAGVNDTICYGETYVLQGSGGINYTWTDNGFFLSSVQDQNPTVQPDITSTFYLEVEDANTCLNTDSVIINVPAALNVVENFDAFVCFSECSGSIDLLPSGGIMPYSIVWSVLLSDLNETGVCPGTYDYTITDSLLCTIAGSIQVDELPEYFIDDVIITPSTCFGEASGTIEVVDADAVTYTCIPSAITNDTGVFQDLPAGAYSLTVTDAQGCTADTTVSFGSASAPIDIVADFNDLLVCYEDLVSFSAEAVGGSGGFTYSWYNCAAADDTCLLGTGDPFDLTVLQDTTLYVVAFDDLGCPSETLPMSVHFNSTIVLNAGPAPIIYLCEGECVLLETGASGGNGNISVEWYDVTDPNNPIFITDTYTTNQCPSDTALYAVTGNDGCNPPVTDTLSVIVWPKPEAIMDVSVTEGCYPTLVSFFNLTDPAFTDDCVWSLGDDNFLGVCSDFDYTYAVEGEYWPTLTVTTEFGCMDVDSLDVPIEIHGYPTASFTWEPQPVTVLENEVQFIDLSTGGVLWLWDFGGLGDSEEENPMFTFPDIDLFNYPVCQVVVNQFGCADTLCRNLVMGSLLLVYVPNAFTPDGDGTNDYFQPVVRGFEPGSYRLFIYDRWGVQVFTTDNPDEPWIADVLGGDYFAPDDVYVWRIELRELSTAEERVFKGHVTLLR